MASISDNSLNATFIFCTESGSTRFESFLGVLGDKIELKGYNGFLGGLDNKNGLTGEFSVSTEWRIYEIMYHVSTLLPYSKEDPQQIQKKRHIGNGKVRKKNIFVLKSCERYRMRRIFR
jgi:hypothetical protein